MKIIQIKHHNNTQYNAIEKYLISIELDYLKDTSGNLYVEESILYCEDTPIMIISDYLDYADEEEQKANYDIIAAFEGK